MLDKNFGLLVDFAGYHQWKSRKMLSLLTSLVLNVGRLRALKLGGLESLPSNVLHLLLIAERKSVVLIRE
jgi:hypothetical protein